MKRFSEQLQKKAQAICLSDAEKTDLRDRVVSYMQYHPLPTKVRVGTTEVLPLVGADIELVQISRWRFIQGFVGVFVLALVSVSYLAEKTVPGDSLYAVKINFNEEIRSTLTRSSYEKVVWETERLNRRIAEARLLANEGRLTEQVQVEVADAVRSHSENARREIALLKKIDKDEAALASIQLETALDVQTQALISDKVMSNDVGFTEGKPSLIADAVEDSKQFTPGNATTSEEVLPSYDKLSASVESETTRAYELLKNIQVTATGEEKTDIERRLEDIGRIILNANTMRGNDEITTRHELVKALQQTQKLIIFMKNIGIRKVVTVEQIVPVILTVEERNQALKASANKILFLVEAIKPTLMATSTASELQAKFIPALAKVTATASSTLILLSQEEGDLGATESSLTEAKAIIHDIVTILGFDFEAFTTEVLSRNDFPEVPLATSTETIDASATSSLDDISADATTTPPDILPSASSTDNKTTKSSGSVGVW